MKIALDYDSTLALPMTFVLPYINGIAGTNYTHHDVLYWNFLTERHEKEFWAAFDLMDKTGARICLPPFDAHTTRILTQLAAEHQVDIVTSNKGAAVAGIRDWLHRWVPDVAEQIQVRVLGRVSPAEKVQLDYDVFIDDAPALAAAVRAAPAKRMLLANCRWNEFYDTERTEPIVDLPNLRRFRSWDEIPLLLQRLEVVQ